MTIEAGDRIKFSTELLEIIDSQSDRRTEVLVVHEIREEDGFKVIMLGRPD